MYWEEYSFVPKYLTSSRGRGEDGKWKLLAAISEAGETTSAAKPAAGIGWLD